MLGVLAAAAFPRAPAFPSRPIKLIVPNPRAAPPTSLRDWSASGVGVSLGQPVVVDNRAGAAGLIGAQAVVKASPGGNT